jgi:hypothetical protein
LPKGRVYHNKPRTTDALKANSLKKFRQWQVFLIYCL